MTIRHETQEASSATRRSNSLRSLPRPPVFSQSGVVRVAVIVPAVERPHVPGVQGSVEPKPLHEVGIGDERPCTDNGIGPPPNAASPDALVNPPTASNVPSYTGRSKSMGLNGGAVPRP